MPDRHRIYFNTARSTAHFASNPGALALPLPLPPTSRRDIYTKPSYAHEGKVSPRYSMQAGKILKDWRNATKNIIQT